MKLSSCPWCGGDKVFLYNVADTNRRVSEERFPYQRCSSCGVISIAEPPSGLSRYYRRDYYEIPTVGKLSAIAAKSPGKLETVQRFLRSGRLLEVGPAFGVFAWQAKQAGFVVDVIEMDPVCCDYLRHSVGVHVTQSDSPHRAMMALPQHEVIAIWHVLEHLAEPLAFLMAAGENLVPGGILVVAMPNPNAFQLKLMGRHWPHLDAPRHCTLIPAEILTRKMSELGLQRVYLTSDDADARSWNRFGWVRLLMNHFSWKLMQLAMLIPGYVLSLIMAPFDRRNFSGSAYTVVFRKGAN